jgi:hypothetical protein
MYRMHPRARLRNPVNYTTGKGRAFYTKKDIDFIAAHVVPLDIWYIIPVEICTPAPMLRFYPHRQAK